MAKGKEVKSGKPVIGAPEGWSFAEKYYMGAGVAPTELYSKDEQVREELKSLEYKIFKDRNPSTFSKIVNFGANTIGRVIKFSIKKEDEKKMNTLLYLLGYDFDAKQLYGFSVFTLIAGFLLGLALAIFGFVLPGIILIFLGIISFFGVQYLPKQQISVRLSKSSSDLVTMILYLVIFMRQTPNLEGAVQFASDNLTSYIAFDLKKLIWDTAARKYTNIKEALDDYSQRWVKASPAFTDALFLVESSVSQETEEGRLELLDQASQRVLDGTYESMTKYAASLKEPLNTIYMLGMVLPVLGLVLAPMLMAFVAVPDFGLLLALMYDVGLPLLVYFMIRSKLLTRPSGFGSPDLNVVPGLPPVGYFFLKHGKKKTKINAIIPAVAVFILFIIPVFFLYPYMLVFGADQIYISMFITAGLGFGVFVYFKLSVFQLKDAEQELNSIESSYGSALSQMGSVLSQGYPPESTIIKVSEIMHNTPVAEFFQITVNNIRKLGMSIKDAFFDKTTGSVRYFPSPMIIASTKVFVESSQKSVRNAAAATTYIAKHLSNLKRIEGQVKSLLEEVTSGMRVEVGLLSPIMAGIVVGLTTLIGTVLTSLSSSLSTLQTGVSSGSSAGGVASVVPFAFSLFNLSGGEIPLYTFQIIIGIYLITLSAIIGYAISMIYQPGDRVLMRETIASVLSTAMILYVIITFIVTLVFSSVGGLVLSAAHVV